MQQTAFKLNREAAPVPGSFLGDVLRGLAEEKKTLSSKYFYDDIGSRYFDDICELDEYYPYRTELRMLPDISRDLAEVFHKDIDMVEFGAGSLIKIRPVLRCLDNIKRYIPIDIAGDHLLKASQRLREDLYGIDIVPVQADFTGDIELPDGDRRSTRMGFFPGSTIGNFSPEQAALLLKKFRESLGENSWLLIGVDTKKSPSILHRAYNDREGVTARFNKNLLTRINRELNGTFDVDKFAHYAFYNVEEGRVEMHLISLEEQKVSVNGVDFSFDTGESIHTENSYKYSPREFSDLAGRAGWHTRRQWLDENRLFSHHLLYAGS